MWENDRGWRGLDAPQYSIERVRDGRKVTVPLSVIDVLFGREPPGGDRDHVRGALAFWDVIPQIKGDSLMVEIMTPHQSHYYQQKRDRKSGDSVSPHDSGQPTPISFLTVPPESTFDFHVVCDLAHLSRLTASREPGAPDLLGEGATHWKNLLAAAFAHAFEWLGFGAKTAVGYGSMLVKQAPDPNGQGAAVGAGAAAAQSEPSARTETWENAKLSWKPGPQEMTAAGSGRVTAPVKGPDAARALFADPARFEQLKKRGELKNARVEVRIDGNFTVIVRVH
jgi:CRISPR-associated protein Cmr6